MLLEGVSLEREVPLFFVYFFVRAVVTCTSGVNSSPPASWLAALRFTSAGGKEFTPLVGDVSLLRRNRQ